MLLPGPEAQQLAIYIGWLLHRTRGGLVAGTLFVLPGFLAIMALSLIYAAFGQVGIVQALFFGLKAAVVGVVLNLAVWFALHVLFAEVREVPVLGLTLDVPVPVSYTHLTLPTILLV